ncbi:hypothetical protein [Enterobacter phage ST22]|nr:hypothetical protein [Enterobacter phage ST22]
MKKSTAVIAVSVTTILTIVMIFGSSRTILDQAFYMIAGIFSILVILALALIMGIDRTPAAAPASVIKPRTITGDMPDDAAIRMVKMYHSTGMSAPDIAVITGLHIKSVNLIIEHA